MYVFILCDTQVIAAGWTVTMVKLKLIISAESMVMDETMQEFTSQTCIIKVKLKLRMR